MILTTLQKLPKNVSDLGKIIVATGFECLPKVQLIAQSSQTDPLFVEIFSNLVNIFLYSMNSVEFKIKKKAIKATLVFFIFNTAFVITPIKRASTYAQNVI